MKDILTQIEVTKCFLLNLEKEFYFKYPDLTEKNCKTVFSSSPNFDPYNEFTWNYTSVKDAYLRSETPEQKLLRESNEEVIKHYYDHLRSLTIKAGIIDGLEKPIKEMTIEELEEYNEKVEEKQKLLRAKFPENMTPMPTPLEDFLLQASQLESKDIKDLPTEVLEATKSLDNNLLDLLENEFNKTNEIKGE